MVVVVVVDSWLCLFPKAAVLPFPRPPWLQPGPTLQILQDLEDCGWKIRDNCDPLLALKSPVALVRGLRCNGGHSRISLFQGFLQDLP